MASITPKGTTPEIRPVSRQTLEKRARRALKKHGQTLIKTRPNTAARRENGLYCVADQRCEIIMKSVALDSMARGLGVMADHERLDTPAREWDGWMHYIARQETIEIDGQTALHNRQISPEFTTPEAARAWARESGLTGDDLRIVGFNAAACDRQEVGHD